MADDNDKRAKHRALLKKSYEALEAEQNSPEEGSKRRRRDDDSGGGDSGEIMYRGKAVKKGRGLSTPGGGSTAARGRQFRGASVQQSGRKPSKGGGGGGGGGEVKEALKKLTDLHREGLITKSEFERKKQQLLDRL